MTDTAPPPATPKTIADELADRIVLLAFARARLLLAIARADFRTADAWAWIAALAQRELDELGR